MPPPIVVEVDRFGDFFFDGMRIYRDEGEKIREYLDLGRPLKFKPACWRVTSGEVDEGRLFVEDLKIQKDGRG